MEPQHHQTQHQHSQQMPPPPLRALWALGSNGNGQLGVGHDQDSAIPSLACMDSVHRQPDAHWHINDPVDFAAAGGNHSALISCPDRSLWMAGLNDDHQCLRPDQASGTGELSNIIENAANVFHHVPDSLFLQALDKRPSENPDWTAIRASITSSPYSLRWSSIACGWAFTVGVAELELTEGGVTTLSNTESCNYNHQEHLHQVTCSHTRCDFINTTTTTTTTTTAQKPEKIVFVWGAGSFGELGLGPSIHKTGNQPERLLSGCLARPRKGTSSLRYEVFRVRAGLRHVLALARDHDEDGKVVLVGWGNNRHGQIGNFLEPLATQVGKEKSGVSKSTDIRTKITEPTLLYLAPLDPSSTQYKPGVSIVDIACGQNHSLVLLSDGSVYSSGLNKHGQLGSSYAEEGKDESSPSITIHTPKSMPFRLGFQQVAGLPFVDRISCGWSHNVAMNSTTSELYLWGRCDRGQLGNSTPILDKASPSPSTSDVWSSLRKLQIISDEENCAAETICSLSCGSEHTLALTKSGKVYAWGWNEHGNCGVASPPPSPLVNSTASKGDEDRSDVLTPRTIFIPSQTPMSLRATGQVMGGYGSSWILLP
ncbi:hypothetical protein BGW42_008750 [Actinomortierella wolfii]|nr:hypothetical protein BGW42_008750 [Actinomortierella wolfii]